MKYGYRKYRSTKCETDPSGKNEDVISDYGLTASSLARARQTVNEILRERRAISPSMALMLSRLFGNSPEFWLNAQRAVDLWEAKKRQEKKLKRIQPLTAARSTRK